MDALVNVVSWFNILFSENSGEFTIINIVSVLTANMDNFINVFTLKRIISNIEENIIEL